MESALHSVNRDEAEGPGARCFVHNLPSELLCHIFGFLAEYRDRLSSTMVCNFWRNASLSSVALLWSDVVSLGQKPGVLTQMLARTCSVPARLTATVNSANVREVSDALKAHMFHLTHLCVHISESLAEVGDVLAAGLATPAPMLESFVVMDVFLSIEDCFRKDLSTIFSGDSPRLSCFKLYSDVEHWKAAPFWPELQSFLFSPIPYSVLDTMVFNNVVSLAKSLRTLGLDFGDFEGNFADIRVAPRVETLAINISGSDGYYLGDSRVHNTEDLVARLDFNSLRLLTLLFPHGCDNDIATRVANELCARLSTESITVFSSLRSDEMILEGVSSDGRMWEMFDVSPSFTTDIFAGLRSLSLSECEWTNFASWPAAPVLTTLQIRLITPSYIEEDGHKSLFLDIQAAGVLRCPRIETLCLSSAPQETTYRAGFDIVLAPEMITDFLRYVLEYPRTRRPDIYLKGVKILELAICHVATLLSCIGDIRAGPGCLPQQSEGELFVDWEV